MTSPKLPQFDVPPEGITDFFTKMGRALWYCQHLEETIAYYLCIVHEISPGIAEKIAYQTLDKKLRKTLGQLIYEVGSKGDPCIPEEIEERLSYFKEERNWLAHRIQRENSTDLFHGDKFGRLLSRLDAVTAEAQDLNKNFFSLLEDWAKQEGLSQEEIERQMRQIMDQWNAT